MPDGKRIVILSRDSVSPPGVDFIENHLSMWRIADAKQLWSRETDTPTFALLGDKRIIIVTSSSLDVLDTQGKRLSSQRVVVGELVTHRNTVLQTQDPTSNVIKVWDLSRSSLGQRATRTLRLKTVVRSGLILSEDGKLMATSVYADFISAHKRGKMPTFSRHLEHDNRKNSLPYATPRRGYR